MRNLKEHKIPKTWIRNPRWSYNRLCIRERTLLKAITEHKSLEGQKLIPVEDRCQGKISERSIPVKKSLEGRKIIVLPMISAANDHCYQRFFFLFKLMFCSSYFSSGYPIGSYTVTNGVSHVLPGLLLEVPAVQSLGIDHPRLWSIYLWCLFSSSHPGAHGHTLPPLRRRWWWKWLKLGAMGRAVKKAILENKNSLKSLNKLGHAVNNADWEIWTYFCQKIKIMKPSFYDWLLKPSKHQVVAKILIKLCLNSKQNLKA